MGRKAIDYTGQRFGRVVVLFRAENQGTNPAARWWCRCDCGHQWSVIGQELKKGHVQSCGCLRRDKHVTHGQSGMNGLKPTPEYVTWRNMLDRCYNPRRHDYRYWGARGITVCSDWRISFQRFYADMGPKPAGKTLDRINNDGNYEPSNCRWATRSEQNLNRRHK